MNIEFLEEDLVAVINKWFPNLNWEGQDTSASADLILDSYGTIEDDLMLSIAKAMISIQHEEFSLTIRPSENKLILYYFD